jgi:hypothetical protein
MTLVEKFVVSLRRFKNKDVPSGEVWCVEIRRYGYPDIFVKGFMGAHSYSDTEEIITRAFYKALAEVDQEISRAGMEEISGERTISGLVNALVLKEQDGGEVRCDESGSSRRV